MSKELIIMLIITINKRARYNYEIIETYEAGLALTGSEIKSIRNNDVSINEAFVIIRKKEAFIINMVIAQYKFSTAYVPDADRTRKLLLHKSEIKKILQRIKLERLTMVPLKLYLKNNYAKLEIALVRGKKNYDKRELIKQRDNERLRQKR
ncbi:MULTISPECIES: SsrA-binding protein SmpB [Spiroplasma]